MLAFLLLSRENRWSSKSHHVCMFGRVMTEVNAVKFAQSQQIKGAEVSLHALMSTFLLSYFPRLDGREFGNEFLIVTTHGTLNGFVIL